LLSRKKGIRIEDPPTQEKKVEGRKKALSPVSRRAVREKAGVVGGSPRSRRPDEKKGERLVERGEPMPRLKRASEDAD